MKIDTPHDREKYRHVCTKALGLPGSANWLRIHEVRHAIQLAAEKAQDETQFHDQSGHHRLMEMERERQHGILVFGLDQHSSEAEVSQFSKISELKQNDELKRKELTSIFKLDESASWDSINKVHFSVRQLAIRTSKAVNELLGIPEKLYRAIVETLELRKDLDALGS